MNQNQSLRRPFGAGPIEQVFSQWQSGQIGESAALDRVRAAEFIGAQTADYLLELSDTTVRWGYQDHWQAAIGLHRLIWACFEAGRARFAPAGATLAARHLMISANGLWHQPDAGLYREALALGSLEYARTALSPARCELAQFLGILHLDPYVASRTDARQFRAWWRSADEPNSASPDNEKGLPDALTALRRAEEWLRRALTDTPDDIHRLEILKALIQSLCGYEIYGEALDETAIRSLYREALPLVNAFPHRTDIAMFLANVGKRLGEPLPGFDFSKLLNEDWQTIRRQLGIGGVAARLTSALAYAAHNEPATGLALAEKVVRIFDEDGDEQERNGFYRRLVKILAIPPAGALPSAAGIGQLIEDLGAAKPGSAERLRKFGEGVGLTFVLAAESREAEAIELLRRICRAAEELAECYGCALSLHQAQLHVGEAVNQHEKSDADATAVSYHLAWSTFVSIRFYQSALEIMELQADILPRAAPTTAQTMCELMREEAYPSGLPIEEKWQETCVKVASACTLSYERGASADAWFALLRFAKGQTFANTILNTETYDWTADPAAANLFGRWREIEGQVGEGCIDDDSLYEEILTAYGSHMLATSGATPQEQRDNLAWAFDRRVTGQTGARRDRSTQRFSMEEACAELPEDAVLLDLFRPRLRPGGNPFYCLALTRDSQKLFGVSGALVDGFQGISMTGHASEITLGADSLGVAAIRERLQVDYTEPSQTPDGELVELLQEYARGWLGHGLEYLDALYAQGKRHLIVVPCGPLHFLPFHLLHVSGEPLAHRWTVTYLPNMDLLRRPASAARDERACAIYGIDYHAPWARERQLDPLDFVEPEVTAVADACGVAARLNDAVTPQTLREGLATSSIVHIACHGRHNAAAPSLQAIYLTPDAGSDGRVFSADILGRNLSGLSLLSLSACETALGRVDAGDNLRGLAAALASGASAVVGTLWPTRDDANQVFFSRMYACLMKKETRREAFRQAQLATRQQFPGFSDWGAFYLSGSW